MLRESRVPDVSARPAVQVRRQRPRPPLGAPIPEVIGAVLTMTALALLCIVALTAATSSLGLVGPLLFVGAWPSPWSRPTSSTAADGDVQKVRIGLAGLVTGVWLAGYILAYQSHTSPPTELSGLMAVVLGWAFAGQVRDGLKRGKEADDEPDS